MYKEWLRNLSIRSVERGTPITLESAPPDAYIPPELLETGDRLTLNEYGIHKLTPVVPIRPEQTRMFLLPINRQFPEIPEIIVSCDETVPDISRAEHMVIIRDNDVITKGPVGAEQGTFMLTRFKLHMSDGDNVSTELLLTSGDSGHGTLSIQGDNSSIQSHYGYHIPPLKENFFFSQEQLNNLADFYTLGPKKIHDLPHHDVLWMQRIYFHYTRNSDPQFPYYLLEHAWITDRQGNVVLVNGYTPEDYARSLKEVKVRDNVSETDLRSSLYDYKRAST